MAAGVQAQVETLGPSLRPRRGSWRPAPEDAAGTRRHKQPEAQNGDVSLIGTAIPSLEIENDIEFLMTPRNSRSFDERAIVEQYFKVNYSSNFREDRLTRSDRFVHVGITVKDGGNLINQTLWEEILALDQFAKAFEFKDENDTTYTYKDICAKNQGKCVGNWFLDLTPRIHEVETREYLLTYPVMFSSDTFDQYVFPTFLSGIALHPDNTIKSAQAMRLSYWCDTSTQEKDHLGSIYEKQFLAHYLRGFDTPNLDVTLLYSTAFHEESERNTMEVTPFFSATLFVMVIFGLVSLTMGDCVRSKTFLGLVSIASSALATVSAFGFLLYCGVPFVGVNMAAPFLMLGIGLDDTFVMVSAWRGTRLQDPVPERLGNAYSSAAVSITITSLTNMISFLVGAMTPFRAVQAFCLYLALSVFVTYVYHITLFGACLALSGRAESRQLHSVAFIKVKSPSESKEDSCMYRSCCSGGISADDPHNREDNQPHVLMVFFRDYVAEFLNMPAVKVIIGLVFVVYIGIAVYGWTVVGDGMDQSKSVRYDSFTISYFNFGRKYFRAFDYRPMIVFTGDITYSDQDTEKAILNFIEKVESHPSIGDSFYSECWLRNWAKFMAKNGVYLGLNNSDEQSFINNLQEYYLAGESNNFRLDVTFSEDNSRIVASRCIVQAVNVMDGVHDRQLTEDLRRWADESPFNVTVFHSFIVLLDHLSIIRSTCLTAVCCAAAIMVLIAFIFIPNPMCSLWVGMSVVSIEVGIVGYMGLWGVDFDVVSMIQLIMCIGFSVDFTAHICYAYLSARVDTPEERVREALYFLGLPIMQGALSTLLSISVLMFVPSYIFITFFKTAFMVIFFGTLHGLFLIPVFLSLFDARTSAVRKRRDEGSRDEGVVMNRLSSFSDNRNT